MAGRLRQSLTNWTNGGPAAHAEYAAEHALQLQHFHVEQLLAALEQVDIGDVVGMARRLVGGPLHVDGLVYGNATEHEAAGGCFCSGLAAVASPGSWSGSGNGGVRCFAVQHSMWSSPGARWPSSFG